jgi:hypothetical protein
VASCGLVSVALASSGCASTKPEAGADDTGGTAVVGAQDVLVGMPSDLTIDITILPGRGARGRTEAHLVRSKYILFPDGSLHGDIGRSMTALTRPGMLRHLNREAMADLWRIVQQSGLGAPEAGDYLGNTALLAPAANTVLTIVTIRADGRTGTFVRRAPMRNPDPAAEAAAPDSFDGSDPSVTRLVRAIASLAWASDDPPAATLVQPIRYDLGPDPYARFKPATPPRSTPRDAPTARPDAPPQSR